MLLNGFCAMLTLFIAAVSAEHGFIRDNDKNGDKKLSWSEVEPIGWSKLIFELKDMNGDGLLSERDLWDHVEWLKNPAVNPKIIKAMDANGDGLIQKDEWWWGDEFAGFDKDKDGVLDNDELIKIPPALGQKTFLKSRKKSRNAKKAIKN